MSTSNAQPDAGQAGKDAQSANAGGNIKESAKKMSAADRKKLEDAKKAEDEERRAAELAKEEEERQAKEQFYMDFKNRNRIRLEYLHAFGTFTGGSDLDIRGHIHLVKDHFNSYTMEPPGAFNDSQRFDSEGNAQQITNQIDSVSRQEAMRTPEGVSNNKKHTDLQLIYPVGRHVAFKSLDNQRMRFLQLPNEAKRLTAITMNKGCDLLAIAYEVWDFEQFNMHHQKVEFYLIEKNAFRLQSQCTIKATQGASGIPPVYMDVIDKKTGAVAEQTIYDRHIQDLIFSRDDKFIALCIKNGPSQYQIQTYDMMIKGKVMCRGQLNKEVCKIAFMPRNSAQLIIAGAREFRCYSVNGKEIMLISEFNGIPRREDQSRHGMRITQTFTSFCYTACDHIVGCSNMGDLFIIQLMDVVQIIPPESLIKEGTPVGDRLNFKQLIATRFGFIAATDDVMYFFQFQPNKEGSEAKGTYSCVLKWRAKEFVGTKIVSISVCEPHDGADGMFKFGQIEAEDSWISVSTKNNQIIHLNLFKEVYYPDYLKLVNDMKTVTKNELVDSPLQSEDESDESANKSIFSMSTLQKKHGENNIKTIGIEEEMDSEDLMVNGANGHKKANMNKKLQEKKENELMINAIKYSVIASGFHQGEISCMDICIHRPIIATLSKADTTIRVWNYDTGENELIKSYHKQQKEFTNSYLQSIALHPSGFYLAVAFIDSVQVFHLLQGSIREYRKLEIKNCHILKFSNGGHMLACVNMNQIQIYHSYILDAPKFSATPSSNVNSIEFNEDDTFICVVCRDGFLQQYDIRDLDTRDPAKPFEKKGEGVIDYSVSFFSSMYSRGPRIDEHGKIQSPRNGDESETIEKVYAVGRSGPKLMVRCYNEDYNCTAPDGTEFLTESPFGGSVITDIIQVESPERDGQEVDPSKKVKNLVMCLDNGRLYTYGLVPYLQHNLEINVMNSHHGTITMLRKSHDNRILVSCGKDGMIFVYKVSETSNKNVGSWSRKLENLKDKYDMEMRRQKAAQKKNQENQASPQKNDGEDQKNLEDQEEGQEVKKPAAKEEEVEFTDSDEEQEVLEKANQRRDDEDFYGSIDTKLSQTVLIEKNMMDEWRKEQEQLKLDMEKENNTVESSLRREKYNYEKNITSLERVKSEDLNKINRNYEDLQQQEAEEKDENTQTMKKMQLNHQHCKEELESLYEKKIQLEIQSFKKLNHEKDEMEASYEEEIKNLQRLNEQAIESLLNSFKNELQTVQEEYDKSKRTADGLKMIFEEKLTQTEQDDHMENSNQMKDANAEIQTWVDVNTTIKDDIKTTERQKNREIEETKELTRKTRIAEMKKEDREEKKKAMMEDIKQLQQERNDIKVKLKKKEKELLKFKIEIQELEKRNKVLTHTTQEMKLSLEPKEQQIENLKDSLLVLEKVFDKQRLAKEVLEADVEKRKNEDIPALENAVRKEKARTKAHEQTISKFVKHVHQAYESRSEDVYIEELMKIYRTHVKKHIHEIVEKRNQDPDIIEEMKSQLLYMNKAQVTLHATTTKNQAKTKVNIQKRRLENNELINDLDNVRISKRYLEERMRRNQLNIQMLRLEKQKMQREFDKKLNAIENETIKKVREAGFATASDNDDSQFGDDLKANTYKQRKSADGPFFSHEQGAPSKARGKICKGTPFLRGNAEDKNKIAELNSQLEEGNQQILLQKLEKRSLQEQIIRLLDERADDLGLTEEEKKAQLSRLNIKPFQNQNDLNDMTQYGPEGIQTMQNQDILH